MAHYVIVISGSPLSKSKKNYPVDPASGCNSELESVKNNYLRWSALTVENVLSTNDT
jgi:hypothetical protein